MSGQAQEKNDSIRRTTIDAVEIRAERPSASAAGTSLDFMHKDQDFFLHHQGNTFMSTLEQLPGISALETGTGIAKPVIRGMSVNRVIVNEYGIKQEGQQWGNDHGLEIDQFSVDRIEIIKGPVSMLYGSDGIGGMINILPPEIPAEDHFSAEALTHFKSGNMLWGGSVKTLAKKNGLYTLARASYQNYGAYRVPASDFTYNGYVLPIYNRRLKNTGGRELNFSLLNGIRKKWGESSLYLSNYRQKAGLFPGAFGIPRSYQLTPSASSRKIALPSQLINHFKAISNTRIRLPAGQLFLDIGYQYNLRQELSLPHGHGLNTPEPGEKALQLDLQTWTGSLRYERWIKGIWKNSVGVSAQLQGNTRSGYEFLIPDYWASQAGVFYHSQLEITRSLLLSAGIRADLAGQKAPASFTAGADSAGSPDPLVERSPAIDKRYSNFSWALGAAYTPASNWAFKLNAGTAFRLPAMAELSSNGIHHGTFRHEKGDADLGPERGFMLDLSGHFHSGALHIGASAFLNRFSNYLYLAPTARFSTMPEGGQVYAYTSTAAVFTGFEVDWSWKALPFLTYTGNMEYVWNRNERSGLPLPFTPPFSILNELAYQSGAGSTFLKQLQLGLIGHYYADQFRVDRNEKTTPGYFLLHFSASKTFHPAGKNLRLFIQVRNLANVRYLNHMSRYRILNLPEPGRNILITLQLEL